MIPATVMAQQVSPTDTTESSNTVTVQSAPSENQSDALTSLPAPKDRPAPDVTIKKTMTLKASAYSSTVDQTDGDPFTTANGTRVADGIIAMNGVPFGTKIRIPDYFGDKVFTVTDRMNAKWGSTRIDIWMPTRAQAIQWGVRTVTINIVS